MWQSNAMAQGRRMGGFFFIAALLSVVVCCCLLLAGNMIWNIFEVACPFSKTPVLTLGPVVRTLGVRVQTKMRALARISA